MMQSDRRRWPRVSRASRSITCGASTPTSSITCINGPDDVRSPRELHPLFYGSFDWHSNVHGYWLLATLVRRFHTMPEAARIGALFDEQLTPEKVAAEVAYLDQPSRATFERPYGWAWLLMLCAELRRHDSDGGRRWSRALTPLGNAFATRFKTFLPKARYPIRVGTHFNTAFALALTNEYASSPPTRRWRRSFARRLDAGTMPTPTVRRGSRAATISCHRR